jgi:hypothetical protein
MQDRSVGMFVGLGSFFIAEKLKKGTANSCA